MAAVGEGLAQLPLMVAALSSNDASTLLDAVAQLRQLLSMEEANPPIAEVIAAGALPRLIQLLTLDQQPHLQLEAAWAIAIIASEQVQVVVEMGAVPLLVQLLVSSPVEELREQAAWALGNLAGDSPRLRDHLLVQGALPALVQAVVESSGLSLLRNATWAISVLCCRKPAPSYDLVSPALPVLARLLFSTDDEVLADACCALANLSEGPENERIQAIIETNACRRVVELILSGSHSIQVPALRIIGNIVTGDDLQTQHVLDLEVLSVLHTLLASPKKNIRKEACWALSNITTGTSAHIQAVIDSPGSIFPRLVALLVLDGGDQADLDVTVQAAWAVSNATSIATPEQMRYLVEQAGCIRPLCALLGCDGNDKIPAIVLEALFNIVHVGAREAGESGINRYAVHVKELGALGKVAQLQAHGNDDIRDKAERLLRCIYDIADDVRVVYVDMESGSETSPAAGASNVFSFDTCRAVLP